MPAPTPTPTVDCLSRTTRALHWLVGVAVLGLLADGFWLQTVPTGPGKTPYVQIHKSFGILVFVLALARVLWRWREGFPKPAGSHAVWERRSAVWLHVFMLAATLLLPVTGILRSLAYGRSVEMFGLPLIPRVFAMKQEGLYAVSANLHDTLALALALGIALHVAAATKHLVIDRDGTVSRILFGSRRDGSGTVYVARRSTTTMSMTQGMEAIVRLGEPMAKRLRTA